MGLIRRTCAIILAISLLSYWSGVCFAGEDTVFNEVFKDAIYGGLAGGLFGVALLEFAKHPGNHLDYMAYGAAGGAVIGGVWGLVSWNKSLVEIREGKAKLNIPTVMPDIQEKRGGRNALVFTTGLVSGTF